MPEELNLVDGLYKYSHPGLNALEREWYHTHVLTQEGLLESYQDLVDKVVVEKNTTVGAVYQALEAAQREPAKALSFFGRHFVDVQLIQQEQARFARCSPDRMAEMILRSRLKPDWVSANLQWLTNEYGWLLTQEQIKSLIGLPRTEWLSNAIREQSCRELVGVLPSWQIRALKDFVENELLEGADSTIVAPVELSESLGKPSNGVATSGNQSQTSEADLKSGIDSPLVTA